jgi:hypothetical protein
MSYIKRTPVTDIGSFYFFYINTLHHKSPLGAHKYHSVISHMIPVWYPMVRSVLMDKISFQNEFLYMTYLELTKLVF